MRTGNATEAPEEGRLRGLDHFEICLLASDEHEVVGVQVLDPVVIEVVHEYDFPPLGNADLDIVAGLLYVEV